MRRVELINNEYYHIYNHGVENRNLFTDRHDVNRFLESMRVFNTRDNVGSIYALHFDKKKMDRKSSQPLVSIVAYCLNPNHYHMILQQKHNNGISAFMKRLGGGYARYFNERYKRSGALFQGAYKVVHIKTNEQLLHVSAYVNLNNKVHTLSDPVTKGASSWGEYVRDDLKSLCDKDVVLGQFSQKGDYKVFAEKTLRAIVIKKKREKDSLLME